MLQPRKSPLFFGYLSAFLLLCLCFDLPVAGNAERSTNERIQNGDRYRRHDGEVTVLSLEEDAKSPRVLGVLSSTARTFVQGGTTTEFTTQIVGTTLGKTYARLLSTGSRVFYDNTRPPSREKLKPTDAFLVFPTILKKILDSPSDSASIAPTQVEEVKQTNSFDDVHKLQDIDSNHANYNKLTLDDLFDLSDTRNNIQNTFVPDEDEENVVFVRKEYSVKRNSDIKAAKVVNPNNDLPTFTVRHEFAPSGFSYDDSQEKKEDIIKPGKRNGKALFRGGIPVKQEKKLDVVTYFGFADFTTTVGDTVIVFMPKTPDPQLAGAVTSITGEATLRPEDAAMPVVTTVKTFMSHSPGMATKTVTGHTLSMHTSLPTILGDPVFRESKAYEPVYVSSDLSKYETDGNGIVPSSLYSDHNGPIESSMEMVSSEDLMTPQITATEPLSTFATRTTQIYNSAEEALGLVKSIGGTEAFSGTTTVFTSFVYGTVIEGVYKQLIQSASSVFINVGDGIITTTGVGIGIAPSSTTVISNSVDSEETTSMSGNTSTEENETTTDGNSPDPTYNDAHLLQEETTSEMYTENELSNEVDSASKIDLPKQDPTIVSYEHVTSEPTSEYITEIVPSTVYKTFTYLTTFFIPDDHGSQTTSIRSREVTSQDITYATRIINAHETELVSTVDALTEVVTELIPSTLPQDISTTDETMVTEPTTPQVPITIPEQKTPQTLTTTEKEDEEDLTTITPTTPKLQEEEVDLIFKTLYTTYTYLTTFFQESSTSVSSREVVVTNVITTTLDNTFASDLAVAGLFGKDKVTSFPLTSDVMEPAPTSVGIGRPTTKYFEEPISVPDEDLFTSTLESVDIEKELQTPTPTLDSIIEEGYKTFYTTYTYFTTVFVDGETEVESRTEVYTNVISTSPLLSDSQITSDVSFFSSDYVSVLPDEQVESPQDASKTHSVPFLRTTPTRFYDSTISRPKIKYNEVAPLSEALFINHNIDATNIDDAYRYDTTMSRDHTSDNTQTSDDKDLITIKQQELLKEKNILNGITPVEDAEVLQTVVVDVTSSTSGGSRKVYRESYDDPDDQITSESNTEEIEPSFSPTILLQTSYTTFTYFTTVYKGTTSDVISRLDTVTNVVTETIGPSDIESSLSPEEATLPITYFTTFTYWTTLYKDGSTMVTSREETISNIVTPTVTEMESTESIDIISPTSVVSLILPTVLTSIVGENSVDSLLELKQFDSGVTDSTINPVIITSSPTTPKLSNEESHEEKDTSIRDNGSSSSSENLEPTTFYTTYTYFTTSYIGNNTVLNSRLETITNIVTPTVDVVDKIDINTTETTKLSNNDINTTTTLKNSDTNPTGLISTIRTSEINNGITTLFSTDVFGTYIDGLYAQILESSTEIVSPTASVSVSTTVAPTDVQATGVVSINEGKIIDAEGISTTFFTTKAIGTYIDKLYAEVIESTTSVQVDENKKTAAQSLDPSTTVVGSKTFRTGLVRLIEGSIVKDKTTTFYESRVIGTLIEGRYAQIIESTSSFKVEMAYTTDAGIAVTSTGDVGIFPTSTITTSPSPSMIESSIGDNESESENEDNENDDDDDESSKGRFKSRLSFSTRKKTFTPVIRPFASRPRPTFLPKKKTGDIGSATTITRNAFTPTITATPAVKSSERAFGSSRNRFAGGRRSSSSNAIQSSASVSPGRRFSGRRGSSTSAISLASSSPSNYRGRSSARIIQTASSSFGSSSKRGGFNYKTSAGQRISSTLAGSSRFRIRPTLSLGLGKSSQTVISTTEDIVNTNDIGGITVVTEDALYTVQEDEQETSPPTTTTTESPRRSNNPLLRFRRPPILQRSSTTTTTSKPTTSPARRNSLLRRPDSRSSATTPLTPSRNRPTPTFPPRNRQRPSNSLFPPRGLLRKPTPAEEAEEEEEDKEEVKLEDDEQNVTKLDEENDFSDNDYDGSEHSDTHHTTVNGTITTEATKPDRIGKALNPNSVQIRPFQGFRRPRVKRQATEYGTRNYRSRYQRPIARTTSPDYAEDSEPVPSETPASRTSSRFTPRSRGQTEQSQPRVRPTKASTNSGRSQFTLRDKSSQTTRSNFKRPTSRRRTTSSETTSTPQRPKPPRLRTQSSRNQQQDTTYTSRNNGRRFTSSRRPSSRSRYRESTEFDTYSFSQSSFDGTITVTHQVPTEVTIPVVNGKVTEYKNIITAKPSLEILGPHQYTTGTAKDGSVVLQLTSEITSTLANGAMEVTKFLVYETPTTSVTFTPTTLRGRKTSFSHIVPSTVYEVKQEVSTIQPQIAANAPLANLLLSQLLLGNLNLQPNAQQLNPLLGLQNQQIIPPTPTTEFKTKTTTYVTTVTEHTSTVIPLTFRGKEILTTIVDSSTQVITATEYLTETVVVTPTAALGANPQQINSLLIPALLQAQLLGPAPQQPTINPLLGTLQQQILPQNILNIQEEKLQVEEPVQRFVSRRGPNEETDVGKTLQESELEDIVEPPKLETKTRKKVRIKNGSKKPQDAPQPPIADTSVVTLYVSGRRPGEFSTVLSTVTTLGEESSVTVRKREVQYKFENIGKNNLEYSKLPEIGSSFSTSEDIFMNYHVMSALNEVSVEGSQQETESLESIVGDVSRYLTSDQDRISTEYMFGSPSNIIQEPSTNQFEVTTSKTLKKDSDYFLSKSPAECAPLQRIGNESNYWSSKTLRNCDDSLFINNEKSLRVKRQLEDVPHELPKRRRVRVRVPVQRRVNIDEDLDPSEAQRSHYITHQELLQTQDILQKPYVGSRKVKVIKLRSKQEDNYYPQSTNTPRKRVAVRRRRPVNSNENENIYMLTNSHIDYNLNHNIQPSDTYYQDIPEIYPTATLQPLQSGQRKRKKVLVTRKRPVSVTSSPKSTTRRRLVITKKIPVLTAEESIQPATIFSNFFVNLQTDYDYETPALYSEIEQTNDDINYSDEKEKTTENSKLPESEISEFSQEDDIDNIRIPAWIPANQSLLLNSFTNSDIQTKDIPESIVWFYEPTDEVQIDITPTTAEPHQFTKPISDNAFDKVEVLPQTLNTIKTSSAVLSLNQPSETGSYDLKFTNAPVTTEHEEDSFNDSDNLMTLNIGESISIQPEDTVEFESPPKFVRPTKSSVTKKPSRIITSYPGTRIRNTVSIPVQSVSSNSELSYRSKKPSSKKYLVSSSAPSQSEILPSQTQDILFATSFSKAESIFPSDKTLVSSSLSEELEGKSFLTTPILDEPHTPILAESSSSLDNSSDSELPEVPATPTSFITTTIASTRLRTYTYVVTRVSGTESIITSSTSVKPAVKTLTLTIPVVANLETAMEADEGRAFPLATKVMSNGVEVIVAGDRTTMPGAPEILRKLPSSLPRPITLAPSTLTDAMMMLLPHDATQETQDLLTKTYLTTYLYRTTLLENDKTVVSSREELVSNVVTERRPSVSVTPTPVNQVTLTASPSLATGVFHTTYTYLNTLVDGEVPLVLTSKTTVYNTVTAPEDFLQPSEPGGQDTNTYLNTVSFTKTLADRIDFKIISTKDVMTQVIITESNNQPSSVEIKPTASTTDVVKTYFVTYTYFSTMLDGDDTIVHSEVATSSDVVTEKFMIPPKKTSLSIEETKKSGKISATVVPEMDSPSDNSINVFATKTYLTTFTYFTTLLQDNNGKSPSTIVSSRTNIVQNIVTETLDTNILDANYLSSLRSSLQTDSLPIVATATLNDGQKMEITAVGEQAVKQILSSTSELSPSLENTSVNNNVITGSTIIFFDENDKIDDFSPTASRTLAIEVAGHTKINQPTTIENQDTTELSTENPQAESLSAAESQALILTSGGDSDSKPEEAAQSYKNSIFASSTVAKNGTTLLAGTPLLKFEVQNRNVSIIPGSEPISKLPAGTHFIGTGPNAAVSNFLKLGSLGINSLNALGPVINAMAGLIKNNLKSDQKKGNDTVGLVSNEHNDIHLRKNPLMMYAGPKPPLVRSPIYIPVGGLAADSVAEESQNFEGHNVFPDTNQRNKLPVVLGRPTMESPLLAGGIPISPGQVITANSDVIIGRPSVHGVRPPELSPKPYRKDDVPIGMKPPPLPKINSKWPLRDNNGHYIPLAHHPTRENTYRKPPLHEPPYATIRDHQNNYDTINYNPQFFKHPENFKKHPNNGSPINSNEYYISPPRKESNVNFDQRPYQQNGQSYYSSQQNIQVYNSIPNNNFDTRPIAHTDTEALNTINSNSEYVNPIKHSLILLPDNTDFVDQSSINPLLVNIQPSQVANVIIPHGSSTALIYSGEHSQKGEIFNDPSPYPDAEIDHVVDALSTARPAPEGEGITHAARIPINANNLDVPVAPHGINVATGNQQVYQSKHELHQKRPTIANQNFVNPQYFSEKEAGQTDISEIGEYLRPPPPPPTRYTGTDGSTNDDDFVFGDEIIEQDGGEVIQESNARPLRPGQLPAELFKNPSTSMPIDQVDDNRQGNSGLVTNITQRQRPGNDINLSVVNSKPVQLDAISSINNQAPIINGRPGLNKFTDKSQAILAVGSPTKLKPDGSNVFTPQEEQYFNSNNKPSNSDFENPALFAAVNQGNNNHLIVDPGYFGNKKVQNKQPKPIHDSTVLTMNLYEKPPPPPVYETSLPPQLTSLVGDLDTQANTPRPFSSANPSQSQFDRNSQDDTVVGLSPPPPETSYHSIDETSTRPVLTLGGGPPRRPLHQPMRPRPLPPYKFEIPSSPHSQDPSSRPAFPPKLEPSRRPMLPETLSPPKRDEDYFHKTIPNKPQTTKTPEILTQWTSQSEPKPIIITQQSMINPVLQGVLTVEEQPQQPEVITADSKVVLTNVINGHRPNQEIEINITGSQPSLQTVVVGKPVAVPVTDMMPDVIRPTMVNKIVESHGWKDGFIVGSETIIDDKPHLATPVKEQDQSSITNNVSSVLVTTGITTIFGNLFTRPVTPTKTFKPVKSIQSYHTAISVVVEPNYNKTKPSDAINVDEKNDHHEVVLTVEGPEDKLDQTDNIITAPPPTTFIVTHTQTTTVTTTETTVVNSKGKQPSTHTLVLTKIHTSTLLDTVTEVHTLVQQSSILTTVTSTIPQVISTVYSGSAEPEKYIVYSQENVDTTKYQDKNEDSKEPPSKNPHENESIFVVMTDKKPGTVQIKTVPDNRPPPEIQVPDEANEIRPNVLLGNVLTHHSSDSECRPECKASRNELCQKIDSVMRCVCRPGFARMFPDRPCKPTYTYTMQLVLDRYGKDSIRFAGPLEDPSSGPYQRLVDATREGLDRMVMQSDLRDIYHGVEVRGFGPASTPDNAVVKFYVQLSDNTEESRLQDVLHKSLRSNNYSLGGTEVYADKEQIQYLLAEDFDECTDPKYHDCSEDAQCFNLRGTYTCSCKEDFSDLSPNSLYPGRVCSAEQIGCELCNYHGTCYPRNDEEIVCECFQWYGGDTCHINLKVMLLVLVTVGVCLVVLLVVCCVLACMRQRDVHRVPVRTGGGYRRYRGTSGGPAPDKRAIVSLDTSSEGSIDHSPPAYIKQASITAQRQKVLRKAHSKGPAPLHMPVPAGTMERDRSLTVLIPRAKYRPVPSQPTNTLLTMSTFGPEQKLLNYLNPEGKSTLDKQGSRITSRKPSNSTTQSEQVLSRKPSSQSPASRKPSTGALVSAGFEVSATVGRRKELDVSFIEEPHTDLSQPGFNTIRTGESCIIVDIPPPPTLEAELEDIISKVDRLTVSEARSYDETTIHPPTKSLHQDYGSKRLSSSSHRADEGHTMVERDIGSTFMTPQIQLFKTDRGSDISNFDSL